MYNVSFLDTAHGEISENFETWDEAAEYWQAYADTETCICGNLSDMETGEVIWGFDNREVM